MKLKPVHITKKKEDRLYQLSTPIIGLTGGVATGKSSVSTILKEKNIPLLDADQLVKKIYTMDQTKLFISEKFPKAYQNKNIDFKILRELVFSSTKNKEIIEKYIYQYLPEAFLEEFKKFSHPSFLVYDIPLLFEKNLSSSFDLTICVYAPKEIQQKRLCYRDKIQNDLAKKIISSQWDIEKKRKEADFVIDNSETFKDLEEKVEVLVKKILL